jgi:hypothetical protein
VEGYVRSPHVAGTVSLVREELRRQRERVLELATLVVPGHAAPFRRGPGTPR